MSRLARARGLLREAWVAADGEGSVMNCEEAEVLMHALIDGELDAGHAREVEAHIVGCAGCAARLREFRTCAKP